MSVGLAGAAGTKPYYPVQLDLVGAPALMVGAGRIAARKIEGLVAAGAKVTVVAPNVSDEVRAMEGVRVHEREYRRGECASYRVVMVATGVRAVDEQVATDARAAGVPINVADVPDLCTFILPAILRRGDLQVTVSTAGRSPAFASWVRSKVGETIDGSFGEALDLVAAVRRELHDSGRTSEIPGWHEAFDAGFVDLVASGDHAAARDLLLQSFVSAHKDDSDVYELTKSRGEVVT